MIYLYVLRGPEFIFDIFREMNVCMCVCVCVCMYVSKHVSAKTLHSIELKFGRYHIGHCRTNPSDFGEYSIYSFYTG